MNVVLYSFDPLPEPHLQEVRDWIRNSGGPTEFTGEDVGRGLLGWRALLSKGANHPPHDGTLVVLVPTVHQLGARSISELADRLEEARQEALRVIIFGTELGSMNGSVRALQAALELQSAVARENVSRHRERMEKSPELRSGRYPKCFGCEHEVARGKKAPFGHPDLGGGRVGACLRPGCGCTDYTAPPDSAEGRRRARLASG